MWPRRHAGALPSTWTVREARDEYLRVNGFSVADYDLPYTPAKVLGIPIRVPNPPRHRRAIMRHDLHHVATGFGTDLVSEGEISAWELARGARGLDGYTLAIVVSLFLTGVLLSPRRIVRAWRSASRGPSLFDFPDDYEALLDQTVGELRARLGIPDEGLVLPAVAESAADIG